MSRLANLPAQYAGLAAGQSALLAQIRRIHADHEALPPRGLLAYQSNARMSAALALRAAYPVVAQLIGGDSFDAMVRHFWHVQPPTLGDWAQWGADLPEFLAQAEQLANLPYLPDVARLEWALHQSAGATDASQDPTSFALLTTHTPEQIGLQLGFACLLASPYPLVAIVQAHSGEDLAADAFAALAPLLDAQEQQTTLVWRKGFAPQMRVLQPTEYAFVAALVDSASLGHALAAAGEDFDFSAWLTNCFQNGLVQGAYLHAQP